MQSCEQYTGRNLHVIRRLGRSQEGASDGLYSVRPHVSLHEACVDGLGTFWEGILFELLPKGHITNITKLY